MGTARRALKYGHEPAVYGHGGRNGHAVSQRLSQMLRIMTYNVHRCVGTDRRCSPGRIAAVISRYSPDIVALQELDHGRRRTSGQDQAALLAAQLDMHVHYHALYHCRQGSSGNAILSRYPLQMQQTGLLDQQTSRRRGALWVVLDLPETQVHVVATHLGLMPREQVRQAMALLGPAWLQRIDPTAPLVICGDFNTGPGTVIYRHFAQRLRDVQAAHQNRRPCGTWHSRLPLRRIDHIFVSGHFQVVGTTVGRSRAERRASDHLPLTADLLLHAGAETIPA